VTINDVSPSQISYGSTAFTYTAGYVGLTLTPTAAGGTITSWSVSPALPQGLNFDTATGVISGTPTTAAASASYVITAQNSGGSATVTLTIAVVAAPLMHLGHQSPIVQVRATANNVLSLDAGDQWVLWDYSGHSVIASGNGNCVGNCSLPASIDLAGTTAAVVTATGFELHSTTDGSVLGTVSTRLANWWRLATDGSYLAAGNSTGVSAWSPSGKLLFSNSGDYSQAVAFATPGQLLIGGGPAGASVIETIAVSSGASSTGPTFNGAFSSWFPDGGRFITLAGTTALVYSTSTVTQVGSITGMTSTNTSFIQGQGNWVWTFVGQNSHGPLNIYPATGSNMTSSPAASYTFPGNSLAQAAGSGSTIGVATYGGAPVPGIVSIIDLSGASPTKVDYTATNVEAGEVPWTYPLSISRVPYAAVSASQWVVGGNTGVLVDGPTLTGTPTYFGFGKVLSIAGGTSHFAMSTASGTILYFNTATLAPEGQISFAASQLRMSADGTLLAAVGDSSYASTDPVRIYSLPSGGLLYTWPYDTDTSGNSSWSDVGEIDLSGSGTVLGQVLGRPSGALTLEASAPTGGSPIFSVSATQTTSLYGVPIRISPDGTLIAYSLTASPTAGSSSANIGTNLLLNGSLVSAFNGLPTGWLDNGRLVVNNYKLAGVPLPEYAGCSLYGADGAPTGAPCALPIEVLDFQPISSDTIYTSKTNRMFSLSTGAVTWASGDPVLNFYVGAVAGSNVIFISGIDALAQPY
jgi:hypothetical protein